MTAERKYDAINNEGGEGYNPIRAARQDRATEIPRTKHDVMRDIDRCDCSIARESGTYDADKVASLRDELAAIEQAELDAFASEWTADVTQARREAWNAEIRKLAAKHGRTIPGMEINDLANRLGYRMEDIVKAKAIHGIA